VLNISECDGIVAAEWFDGNFYVIDVTGVSNADIACLQLCETIYDKLPYVEKAQMRAMLRMVVELWNMGVDFKSEDLLMWVFEYFSKELAG
jgi:hypothetical protein